MEPAKRQYKPQATSTSTDFDRDPQIYDSSQSPKISVEQKKHFTTKVKKQRPFKPAPQAAPKIAIHEANTIDVNKSGAGNVKKWEKSSARDSDSSGEESKGLDKDFHLSVKGEEKESDDESSLVRSDCLHEDELTHLAQEMKGHEEESSSVDDGFVPKTVDEADQMGALDDFLLDNEGDDYVPPTMEVLVRKETAEIRRQVTDGSMMSQESARLIRTKGSVNEKAKQIAGVHDYNKLKNERERQQHIFRECLDMELLGKDFRTEESAQLAEEEDPNITLLRATRTEGSANLIEVVSHLKEVELNGRGSNSPKISTFKKKAQKKLSRQGKPILNLDLLHVMYKIPKHLTPKKETVPVLSSKSRKHSRMGKTLEKKIPVATLNPPHSRNERANLSASLNPKYSHKHNKSYNMYEGQPKRSSSRLPQKAPEPLLCKTPQIQFVSKLEPPKSNDTPPKNFIKTTIQSAIETPNSIVKNRKKDSPVPKETQSSNRVNMYLDFDLDKKKNHWKEVYEVPASKATKIFSKKGPGSKMLNQSHVVVQANMTSSISPRVAAHTEKTPATSSKKPSSPLKGKNTGKTPMRDRNAMNKTLQSLKPRGKKPMLVSMVNQGKRKKKNKNQEELKEIDSDSDDLQRAATNALVADGSFLEKQVTQKSSYYEVQRSVSYLGSSSSEDNKSETSSKGPKKKKDLVISSFKKVQPSPYRVKK